MALTLSDARRIIEGAKSQATQMGQRVAIAVVDDSGGLMSMDRLDGAKLHRDRFARGKALAAVLLEQRTNDAKDLHETNPSRYLSILNMFPGEIYLSFGGGVPIVVDGAVVGAIGVAGASHGLDDQIADAGISAWEAERSLRER